MPVAIVARFFDAAVSAAADFHVWRLLAARSIGWLEFTADNQARRIPTFDAEIRSPAGDRYGTGSVGHRFGFLHDFREILVFEPVEDSGGEELRPGCCCVFGRGELDDDEHLIGVLDATEDSVPFR